MHVDACADIRHGIPLAMSAPFAVTASRDSSQRGPAHAQTAPPASAQQADQTLLAAAGKDDATAAGALLDADFEWTTPAGVNHKRDETLANLSALATNTRGETGVQSYSYDQHDRSHRHPPLVALHARLGAAPARLAPFRHD